MKKIRKPYPIDGNEQDCTYARRIYCYLRHNHNNVKFLKRKMNKRFRQQEKKEILKELL